STSTTWRQPVNVDTERQRNPASVRIPPPCSRNDSRDATRLIRSAATPLQSARNREGRVPFSDTRTPKIDHRLILPFNRIKHLLRKPTCIQGQETTCEASLKTSGMRCVSSAGRRP